MHKYLGNQELLNAYKLGFLCSSRVSSRAILPCYDWVTTLPSGSVVMSGFHSPIERDVLQLLLGKGHSVIVVLARKPYTTISAEWQSAYDDEGRRMLIVSTSPEASRVSKPTADLAMITFPNRQIILSLDISMRIVRCGAIIGSISIRQNYCSILTNNKLGI